MNSPKVSVIVPIYKVERYLVQCIDSIVNQTLKDIEIILIDEGDIDACRFIIDHYEQTDNRVKAIHEKNGGYGASVNKGFDIAAGEYISIIESDDFIEPKMLEEMYNYAKKLDADVVKTPYYEYWDKKGDKNERVQLCFWYQKTKNIPENKLFSIENYPILMGIHPSIWAALYKTEYLRNKNIRCIEAKGAGYVDNHFRTQAFCQTDKIAFLNKPFNYYRLSNEDASTVHYDLSAFITRWADVHKLFKEKFPEKWNVLAPYCIKEEWINTFFRVAKKGFALTNEDYETLLNNLSYMTIKQIKACNLLSENDRQILIKLKETPTLLQNHISKTNIQQNEKVHYKTKFKISVFGILLLTIKSKLDYKYKGYLFGFIPIFTVRKGWLACSK